MTGFDSVIPRVRPFLFGIALVPVTHTMHPIAGNALTAFRNAAADGEARFFAALAPATVAA